MSELDKEFQATIEQVNAKLKEAATALRQANDLAKLAGYNHGLINSSWAREAEMSNFPEWEEPEPPEDWDESAELPDDPYDIIQAKYDLLDIRELESAMSDAGWQPSSSYC